MQDNSVVGKQEVQSVGKQEVQSVGKQEVQSVGKQEVQSVGSKKCEVGETGITHCIAHARGRECPLNWKGGGWCW